MPTTEENEPIKFTPVADFDKFQGAVSKASAAVSALQNSRSPQDVTWMGWAFFRQLQQFCRDNSVAKGFGKEGDDLRDLAADLTNMGRGEMADQMLANYFSKRMNLIHDELAEAHEELRNGRLPDEQYVNEKPGKEGKPEGIPSELADVIIRVLDLAGEYNIDLADVIFGKTAYNASREAMHGRKF